MLENEPERAMRSSYRDVKGSETRGNANIPGACWRRVSRDLLSR